MPYSYHKQGDKYVVTKKDTGKVVGRTKGTKEALNKYLAALHINANENKKNIMKKSELTKMIQEVIKEVLSEQATNNVNIPLHIEAFAKRKGVFPLVKKVASWAKSCNKIIHGGTAIGKNYSTLVLDLSREDGAIRINLDDQTVELYGEEVSNVNSFKMALDKNAKKMNETDYMNRRKKQDADYTTNKKDAPKKQSKMSTPTGKTDYMKRREAEKKMQEAAPAKAKDLGLSEKGYFKVKFPAGTREEAIKSIETLLKSDQAKYPGLKVDIMPLKKEEDKDFAVIKLNGEGAHTVGLKMKAAYKDKAGFKGAVIKPYHPTFQSK